MKLGDGVVDDRPTASDDGGLNDFVFGIELETFGFGVPKFADQGGQVVGIHLAGIAADFRRQIALADDFDAFHIDDLVQHGPFNVSARFHRHVNHDATRLHAQDHVTGHDARCRSSEKLCGGDNDVGRRDDLLLAFLLKFNLFRCQSFRVTLLCLSDFAQIDFDELGAE